MLRSPLLLAVLMAAVFAPSARAADYVPGEVIVRYAAGADRAERAATQRATGVGAPRAFAPRTRVLRIRDGESVEATVAELRRRRGVATAAPNLIARASFLPLDPGRGATPGGWQNVQWNFLPATGVNAPVAWDNVLRAGRPGGRGVVIAVLDTGVAYADRGRYRRSPDLAGPRFRRGYDFIDDDAYPNDANGHGTHVASTIAESINNGVGVTGLAYGARVMPVRVLNGAGEGNIMEIAAGIRFAARRGAQIINLSFEFGQTVTAGDIPELLAALRYARGKGALVVGASGNSAARSVAYPARSDEVLSVGATTEHGCLADYSNGGIGLDLVAPGGGPDAELPGDPNCRPGDVPRARHRADDLRRQRPPLQPAVRLQRHVNGHAARVGHRRAGHRLRRARPRADGGGHRSAPEGAGARPRPARAGRALRRRPDRRRGRDHRRDPLSPSG